MPEGLDPGLAQSLPLAVLPHCPPLPLLSFIHSLFFLFSKFLNASLGTPGPPYSFSPQAVKFSSPLLFLSHAESPLRAPTKLVNPKLKSSWSHPPSAYPLQRPICSSWCHNCDIHRHLSPDQENLLLGKQEQVPPDSEGKL
jgi:hypothetical protein